MIEVIKTRKDWNDFLSFIEVYDSYHTFDYHQLMKTPTDTAVIIKYKKDDVVIGLPLLVRKINGSDYYDATSVYGYSGPISKGISYDFNFKDFRNSLLQFFSDESIISVFVRLNPYLPYQNVVFNGFGELSYLGKVVNINLNLDLDKQRQKYHRRLKNQVNKAYKQCSIKLIESDNDFEIFKELYFKSMDRVNARKFYYFDDNYFDGIRNAKDFKTYTLLAFDNDSGKAIAGSMFIMINDMIQYHLSGTSEDFLNLNATKILIDYMRLEGTKKGYKHFNLGGGLGVNENDSLFRFKSSFSDDFHPFYLWKCIVNQDVYKDMCEKNKISKTDSTFFPLYRLKEY